MHMYFCIQKSLGDIINIESRYVSLKVVACSQSKSHSLRLASAPADTVERAKLAEDDIDDCHRVFVDKEPASPRASPR